MNVLEKIKSGQQLDERQSQAQGRASITSLLTLVVVYLGMGIYYYGRGLSVPWSTELLFLVALIVYVAYIIKEDAYNFIIPGMKETEATMSQPAIIRSVPWLLLMSSMMEIVLSLANLFHMLRLPDAQPIYEITTFLSFGIVSASLSIYSSWRLKQGSRFWVGFFKLISILASLGFVGILIAMAYGKASIIIGNGGFARSPLGNLSGLVTIWSGYAIFRYGRRMVEDGKSFIKEKRNFFKSATFIILMANIFAGIIGYYGLTTLAKLQDVPERYRDFLPADHPQYPYKLDNNSFMTPKN